MDAGPRELLARRAEVLVHEALEDTPVTVIQGARQVGKSTLAARILHDKGQPLLTLDADVALSAARRDPHSFVRQRSEGILAIDEVQRAPELLRAVKAAVDEDRRPGRFLLTGSANLLIIPGQYESLAGRAETIHLYGLSVGEMLGARDGLAERLLAGDDSTFPDLGSSLTRTEYLEIICAGSFPEPRARTGRRRRAWFDNYLNRILDRDARELTRLAHIERLPRLLKLLAANNGGELVVARIGTDAGIAETSLPTYLDLLESLYLIHRIPAWGKNLTQRVVGRPKVALLDTGLAACMGNLSPAAMVPGGASAKYAGALVEAFVAGELRRQSSWSPNHFELFHFRDRNGLEVDLVLEDGSHRVAAIEVKASATISARHTRRLEFLRDRLGPRFSMGVVLYTGRDAVRFGDRVWALPLSGLWA